MKKLDLRKELRFLYQPSAKRPAIVEVPPMRYLTLDGVSIPGDERFQAAMQALFTLAYSVRFGAKKELELDYPVMASEGLYHWLDDTAPLEPGSWDPEEGPGELRWTLRIMIPDEVPEDFIERVRADAIGRGKGGPRLPEVEVRTDAGGKAVQMMHIGPYAAEPVTIEKMTSFTEAAGYEITGVHHEIYVGDPSRSAPEKLKTTLRLGVTPAQGAP